MKFLIVWSLHRAQLVDRSREPREVECPPRSQQLSLPLNKTARHVHHAIDVHLPQHGGVATFVSKCGLFLRA